MSVNWIAFWDSLYRNVGIVHEKPDALVVDTVPFLRASGVKTVLDLGSGTARHAAVLAEYGFQIVAMDAAPTALINSQSRLDEFCHRLEHKLIRQVTQNAYDIVQRVSRREREALGRRSAASRSAVSRRLARDAVGEIEYALPPSTLRILHSVARNAMADEGFSPRLSATETLRSTDLAESLRPMYSDRILLLPGDLRRLPFADAHFDCVLSHNVLKFCVGDTFRLAIRESQRVLKPGGISMVKATAAESALLGPNDLGDPGTWTKPSGLPPRAQHLAVKEDLLVAYEGYSIVDLRLVSSSGPNRGHRFARGSRLDWWLVARKGTAEDQGPELDVPDAASTGTPC
jgi:SAM-dependent methyltransferase